MTRRVSLYVFGIRHTAKSSNLTTTKLLKSIDEKGVHNSATFIHKYI